MTTEPAEATRNTSFIDGLFRLMCQQKASDLHLAVGLPIRGQPPGLKNIRDTRGDRVRLRGEVWTILVDETLTGPAGWKRSQYAWLFTRDRSGRLELASTILIGVVQ